MFMAVNYLFSQVSDKINIPLYIRYDEPVSVGSGPSSYEVDGYGTSLGSIAIYFSCLAAYFTFNTIMHGGLSWLVSLTRLNIVFITVGVLIQFAPLLAATLIYMEKRAIPYYVESIISISLEICLLYINWKYTYHLYSRKKSKLKGYKLWAAQSSNGSYYMIIEAHNKTDAFELVQRYTSSSNNIGLNVNDLIECDVKGNLLLKSETNIVSYADAKHIVFKE